MIDLFDHFVVLILLFLYYSVELRLRFDITVFVLCWSLDRVITFAF